MKLMWKQNSVKAFTLGELLVVMLVSSIVIAMTFVVLNMVRTQVKTMQENYEKKQAIRFFETTFTRDFNLNTALYKKEEKRLKLTTNRNRIQYTFLEDMVLRNQDTFRIELVKITCFLDGKIVTDHKIDAISMETSNAFLSQQLFVQQRKDAAHYINN